MALESQTVKIGTAAAIVVTLIGGVIGFYAWADEKHQKLEDVARESAELAKETQTNNKLLTQIQAQQQALVVKAAEDAQANRESLIRIEAKLEQ